MTQPQAPYTTKEPDKILSVYNAVIVLKDASCNPAALFNPDGAADRFAWMNAIQRGYVEIQRVFEIEDTPANGHMDPAALLAYKVIGKPADIAPEPKDDAPTPGSLLGRPATVERRLDELAPAAYMSDVHAPQPSRLTEIELEQERLGDAVCDLHDALIGALQQHAALVARVCGLAVMSEGDHK